MLEKSHKLQIQKITKLHGSQSTPRTRSILLTCGVTNSVKAVMVNKITF